MIFQPLGSPPHRDPSLGREYLPEHGMKAPTVDQAIMWCHGAKAGLRFAAEMARRAREAGTSVEDLVAEIEGCTAVPAETTRYGDTFDTAVIVSPGGEPVVWWAWLIPANEAPAA